MLGKQLLGDLLHQCINQAILEWFPRDEVVFYADMMGSPNLVYWDGAHDVLVCEFEERHPLLGRPPKTAGIVLPMWMLAHYEINARDYVHKAVKKARAAYDREVYAVPGVP